jgi:dihydroneopterin aldolase
MKTTSTIFLQNLVFYAYHGVAPQETAVGNTFIINLSLKGDFRQAMQSDCVDDTVSYADVFLAVKEEMSIPSKLLEHVCGRIVQRLIPATFLLLRNQSEAAKTNRLWEPILMPPA